ncbi:MAG: PTS sugar transporter subunit IIA [Gemmatimonadales bacterium]
MQITVRDAAQHLGVSESTLRDWIKDRGLPAHRVNERLLLNAIEVWEWAVKNGVTASRKLLDEARGSREAEAPLPDLLRAGGIHHDVPGDDRPAVLREIVARLPLPPDAERESLLAVLEAREAMGSTGVGDGIAIPHVRNPILLHVDQPFVTLCLLRSPVDFNAVDGQPVHALFTVVCSSVPMHLKVLAQLGFVLRDPQLRELLRRRAGAEEILQRIQALAGRSTGMFRAPAED